MNRILNRINIYGFCSEERGGGIKKEQQWKVSQRKKKENE